MYKVRYYALLRLLSLLGKNIQFGRGKGHIKAVGKNIEWGRFEGALQILGRKSRFKKGNGEEYYTVYTPV